MTDILAQLNHFDTVIFLYLNKTLANPATDFIMPFITKDLHLKIFYAAALAFTLWKGDKHLRWAVLFSLVVVAISDQTSSSLLKPLFERLRPCKELDVNLLVGCGAGYSMPSSHAANLFAQAYFFKNVYSPSAKFLIPLAIFVALSRVFVGVHYPADIMVGSALGALIGFGVAKGFEILYDAKLSKISFGARKAKSQLERPGNGDKD